MNTINFHHASPILRVNDLNKSLKYYVQVLGFVIDWEYPGIIGSVSRGKCNLMLAEGDQGNTGSWVWIGVGDAQELYEEYLGTGAIIRQAPTNFSWALEIQVQDPDGNVLRFGSDSLANVAYGPWMDMRGKLWT
jgi:catechol 2,3-dioxygenase-like lactoylglutathione lyase family enzyme